MSDPDARIDDRHKRPAYDVVQDVTNVWYLTPSHHREHPAVFPDALAEKVIRYYSFVDDLVLDPFAGSGTVGRVALKMGRRFLLIDNEPEYFGLMRQELIPFLDMGKEILFEPEDDEGTLPPWQQLRLQPIGVKDRGQ